MDWRLLLALLVLTGLGSGGVGDTADVNRYHKPLLPGASTSVSPGDSSANGDVNNLPPFLISVGPQTKGKAEALQPQSRLEIVRYVSGELRKFSADSIGKEGLPHQCRTEARPERFEDRASQGWRGR